MRLALISVLCVSGCGIVPDLRREPPDVGEVHSGVSSEVLVRPQARPFEPETEVVAPPTGGAGSLGVTVASLGNAAEPGMWLKTPLVRREQIGRVFFAQTGKAVALTLIPIEGPPTAGSRLSLAAMQAIGAPLTDLPEVEVFSGA